MIVRFACGSVVFIFVASVAVRSYVIKTQVRCRRMAAVTIGGFMGAAKREAGLLVERFRVCNYP